MAQRNQSLITRRAFSLVEVLVAITIFSLILLPLLANNLRQTRDTYQSYFCTLAVAQAQSMLERLRANHSLAARRREYQAWNRLNEQLLPQGHGSYTCRQYDHQCLVSLEWWSATKQAYALSARIA